MEQPRRAPRIPPALREELYLDQRELRSEKLGGADTGDWVLLAVLEVASRTNLMAVPVMSVLQGRKFMRRYRTLEEATAAASEHIPMRRNGGYAVNLRSGETAPVRPVRDGKHV